MESVVAIKTFLSYLEHILAVELRRNLWYLTSLLHPQRHSQPFLDMTIFHDTPDNGFYPMAWLLPEFQHEL